MFDKLRQSWVRWALLTVPAIVLLGVASAILSDSGYGNLWFDMLLKPAIMPPAWAFPVAWTTLYVLMGIALALIIDTPKTQARNAGLVIFAGQLFLNLAWSPVFFSQHKIMLAFGIIVMMFAWAAVATAIFRHIRPVAAMLMIPYLVWLIFAATLNWQIHSLNPSGGALVGPPASPQISAN